MKNNGTDYYYINKLREITPKLSDLPWNNVTFIIKSISNSLKDCNTSSEEKLEKIKELISIYEDC